jgi:hypothetical protein
MSQRDYSVHTKLIEESWFRHPRHPRPEGMHVICAHGTMPPFDARVEAFAAISNAYPNATQRERYRAFRALLEATRQYHGARERHVMAIYDSLVRQAGHAAEIDSEAPTPLTAGVTRGGG